ncbi:hypothetical protein ACWIGI_36430 [Nocardia sp. NPDC055321]
MTLPFRTDHEPPPQALHVVVMVGATTTAHMATSHLLTTREGT